MHQRNRGAMSQVLPYSDGQLEPALLLPAQFDQTVQVGGRNDPGRPGVAEAADASRLAWAATSLGVDSEPIQSALLGYLLAVRAHEWNGSNAANGDDPATTHAIANLENAVRTQAARPSLGTPVSTELLASLDALTSDRRARLAAASRQLPALYVAVLLLAGAALIVNATALTLRSGRRAALLVGGLAAVIGLSLALLFALGTPWRGPITVSGQPIDAVVRDLNIGYSHPLSCGIKACGPSRRSRGSGTPNRARATPAAERPQAPPSRARRRTARSRAGSAGSAASGPSAG